MAVLENRIEVLNQENANLRSRLEHLENQVRENRSETMRAKVETESLVENSVKWMKEAVNSFDNKLSNYSSSMSKQVEEVASNRESVVRQIEKRVCELENKRSSNQQEQQVLHLLKEELKWLQRQKTKLQAERKESNILQKQVAAKVQHMEVLSAVMNTPFVCVSRVGAFS
jgi:chromosome segregation ATPase